METWYDPRHTGALRVVDTDARKIHGTDPNETLWTVSYRPVGERRIEVDFANKRTHHGRRVLTAEYTERRNALQWSDGNKWLRVRHSPKFLARFYQAS